MGWQQIVDAIFMVRPWILLLLLALYLVPIIRIMTAPFEYGGRYFMRINRIFGKWEHFVMLPRDFIAAPYLAAFTVWQTIMAVQQSDLQRGGTALIAASLVALCFAQRTFRRDGHLRLLDFVRHNPAIHPQEFFDHMLCASGAIRHKLPAKAYRVIDYKDLNFTEEGGSSWSWWRALCRGAWSTAWLARLLVVASRFFDSAVLKEIGSSLALVWAGRVAQLARSHVTLDGCEWLKKDTGLDIFLFTHASYLDFALAAITLAARPHDKESSQPARSLPIFLLARDHFRDNPIYYRLLGIGRAAEALGMIFVERSNKGNRERAELVAQQASGMLTSGEIDLAIYPQGTRAAPCVDAHGERLDSSYYTVGPRERITADGAHLKKGAVHIASQTALALREQGIKQNVRMLPVAIKGTGIVCPKGRIKIKPYVTVCLHIGEPIVISPVQTEEISADYKDFVGRLQSRVDVALKSAARVHPTLERRFFEDIRGMLEPLELEEISLAFKPWRGEDFLVHAILDAIYACPPAKWRALQGELVHLLLNFAQRAELLAFKGRIADAIPM